MPGIKWETSLALNKAAEEIADMRTSIAWLYEELSGLKQSASVANAFSSEQSSTSGMRGVSSDGSGRVDNLSLIHI